MQMAFTWYANVVNTTWMAPGPTGDGCGDSGSPPNSTPRRENGLRHYWRQGAQSLQLTLLLAGERDAGVALRGFGGFLDRPDSLGASKAQGIRIVGLVLGILACGGGAGLWHVVEAGDGALAPAQPRSEVSQ